MSDNNVEIYLEICREGAVIPAYARPGDAGMDVCSAVDMLIHPGETIVIPTGLKLAIPEGYEIQVRPRSGISLKTPLRLANTPGTIDSGYRDELGIIMTNTSEAAQCSTVDIFYADEKSNRKGTYQIRQGDRIAQIVLQRVPQIRFSVVDSVKGIGTDRGGGYGSSGVGRSMND